MSKNVIDDSGMKLIVANEQENRGELENATKIRYSILDIRLGLLKKKLQTIENY